MLFGEPAAPEKMGGDEDEGEEAPSIAWLGLVGRCRSLGGLKRQKKGPASQPQRRL